MNTSSMGGYPATFVPSAQADAGVQGRTVMLPALWVTDSLAVHPEATPDAETGRTELGSNFSVGHAPSGLRIARAPDLETAVAAAQLFAQLPVAWATLRVEDVPQLPADVRAQLDAIRAIASVGGDLFAPASADLLAADAAIAAARAARAD